MFIMLSIQSLYKYLQVFMLFLIFKWFCASEIIKFETVQKHDRNLCYRTLLGWIHVSPADYT